ncbi:MAG: glycosyl hydrolase 53 family protein [Paludibacteraceae bacterium]|nr:glycosyl hydrolase 53 family protein [Paludibacteraceae bacterium]
MKNIINFCLLVCVTIVSSCSYKTDSAVGTFARGADLSWLSEQERDGVLFYNDEGQATECIALLRSLGMNSVRLRVWVNHETGWCNKADVVNKAIKAAKQGQRIMIDFHYSDNFADPQHQTIPAAWSNYSYEMACEAVAEHTRDVLYALKEAGIKPEWVQIGNETPNGMMWPMCKLTNKAENEDGCWERYAGLTLAGYKAAKEAFPKTNVIVHVDNAYEYRDWFFKNMLEYGGKFDMIGLSHYPMMKIWSGKEWKEMNELAEHNIRSLIREFHCPVMVAEVGTMNFDDELSAEVMRDFVNRVSQIDSCVGIFYWEPQCYGGWKPREYDALGWGPYDMGCFTEDGKPMEALKILLNPNMSVSQK